MTFRLKDKDHPRAKHHIAYPCKQTRRQRDPRGPNKPHTAHWTLTCSRCSPWTVLEQMSSFVESFFSRCMAFT